MGNAFDLKHSLKYLYHIYIIFAYKDTYFHSKRNLLNLTIFKISSSKNPEYS